VTSVAEPAYPQATQIAPTLMGAALRLGLSPQDAGGDGGAVATTLGSAIDFVLNSRGYGFNPYRTPALDHEGQSEFASIKKILQSELDPAEFGGFPARIIEHALRMAFCLRATSQPASSFWCKILNMLVDNFAVIEKKGTKARVIFCLANGGVFDELDFHSRTAAEAALIRNGFVRCNAHGSTPCPPGSPLFLYESENRGIYSSGRFWRN
jgi:hypothetical protein